MGEWNSNFKFDTNHKLTVNDKLLLPTEQMCSNNGKVFVVSSTGRRPTFDSQTDGVFHQRNRHRFPVECADCEVATGAANRRLSMGRRRGHATAKFKGSSSSSAHINMQTDQLQTKRMRNEQSTLALPYPALWRRCQHVVPERSLTATTVDPPNKTASKLLCTLNADNISVPNGNVTTTDGLPIEHRTITATAKLSQSPPPPASPSSRTPPPATPLQIDCHPFNDNKSKFYFLRYWIVYLSLFIKTFRPAARSVFHLPCNNRWIKFLVFLYVVFGIFGWLAPIVSAQQSATTLAAAFGHGPDKNKQAAVTRIPEAIDNNGHYVYRGGGSGGSGSTANGHGNGITRNSNNNNNNRNNGDPLSLMNMGGRIGGGCSACRLRKQAEDQSLASFKKHILRRLEMEQPPNITAKGSVPQVAEGVLQSFYHSHGFRYIRANSTGGGADYGNSNNNNHNNNNQRKHGVGGDFSKAAYGKSHSSAVVPSSLPHDEQMYGDDPDRYASNRELFDRLTMDAVNSKYYDTDMYGDDVNDGNDDDNDDDGDGDDDDDGDDEFFSITNSIYAFPKCECFFLSIF